MLHGALKDDRLLGLVVCQAESFVEERLIGEDALPLQATGGGNNSLGLGVVDAFNPRMTGSRSTCLSPSTRLSPHCPLSAG